MRTTNYNHNIALTNNTRNTVFQYDYYYHHIELIKKDGSEITDDDYDFLHDIVYYSLEMYHNCPDPSSILFLEEPEILNFANAVSYRYCRKRNLHKIVLELQLKDLKVDELARFMDENTEKKYELKFTIEHKSLNPKLIEYNEKINEIEDKYNHLKELLRTLSEQKDLDENVINTLAELNDATINMNIIKNTNIEEDKIKDLLYTTFTPYDIMFPLIKLEN